MNGDIIEDYNYTSDVTAFKSSLDLKKHSSFKKFHNDFL